jgi:hypothetical protein
VLGGEQFGDWTISQIRRHPVRDFSPEGSSAHRHRFLSIRTRASRKMLRKLSMTPRMRDGLTIPGEIPTNENRKAESR